MRPSLPIDWTAPRGHTGTMISLQSLMDDTKCFATVRDRRGPNGVRGPREPRVYSINAFLCQLGLTQPCCCRKIAVTMRKSPSGQTGPTMLASQSYIVSPHKLSVLYLPSKFRALISSELGVQIKNSNQKIRNFARIRYTCCASRSRDKRTVHRQYGLHWTRKYFN